MLDFTLSEINTELLTPTTIIYALLLCVILVGIILFCYDFTTGPSNKSGYFIQSMILGSIATCIIIQAVGDSVGRGLGMLGALAIIRFRTNLSQPRNIIFMFASLGIGICCGVYGFNLAVIGTIFFCAFALILKYTPYNEEVDKKYALRLFLVNNSSTQQFEIEKILLNQAKSFHLIRIELIDSKDVLEKEFLYHLVPKSKNIASEIVSELNLLSGVSKIRINIRNDETQL